MRPALATAVAAFLLAVAACGDGGSAETASTTVSGAAAKRLTPAEQIVVRQSERSVQRYCGKLALSAIGQGKPPSASQQAEAFAATDRLVELARSKPTAPVESGERWSLFLGDLAEDLEGSNCDQRLIERIDQALATLPRT